MESHVENLRAAFLRAQAKESRVDALKKDKRLIDAADMERPMNAAIYQFYRAFAKLVNDHPAFWEELSK